MKHPIRAILLVSLLLGGSSQLPAQEHGSAPRAKPEGVPVLSIAGSRNVIAKDQGQGVQGALDRDIIRRTTSAPEPKPKPKPKP